MAGGRLGQVTCSIVPNHLLNTLHAGTVTFQTKLQPPSGTAYTSLAYKYEEFSPNFHVNREDKPSAARKEDTQTNLRDSGRG